MAITSQITSSLSLGELQIIDFSGAGLLKVSIIKPVMTTREKGLVIKKLGKLQDNDCQNLKQIISHIVG